MKVINKKMVVVVLLIIEFTCGYLMHQSSKKEVDLAKVTYEEEIKDSMFAMYVENEDTGEYDEVTNTNAFPEGYILNMDKTGCIDNKGNSISDILTSKDDKVMVKSNKTVFCYLYFDKDNRVFAQVKRDYKNNTGTLLLSETESDEYPVYYYSGNITNNNILYANFCWKMVRTTETGGVKLIYNGVPDEAEDGTLTCDNTGEESQIGTSTFNSSNTSLAHAGYMYNNMYSSDVKGPNSNLIINRDYAFGEYYYGDIATWNETTQRYELSNSDGSEVLKYNWIDNYASLIGKYSCLNAYNTSCSNVSYIVGRNGGYIFHYRLYDGKDYDTYKIKLSTSIADIEEGIYALVNPIEVLYSDWFSNYSNYLEYYYCNDLISEICSDMYQVVSTDIQTLRGFSLEKNYKYGNSFTYENGVYKLVNTIEFWDWHNKYNTLNNNHYTCFNTTGECSEIKYIYYTTNLNAYYITLSDGKNVEQAINEMLYAENVNTTDSTIKTTLDTWYENNIVNILDSNSALYSSYLEDTVWCNIREISDLGGWNPNGGSTSSYLTFNYEMFECKNKTDQFTLKAEAGGTEGYGNNVLDYPIGLISYKEAKLATGTGYLKTGSNYWLFVPFGYSNYDSANVIYLGYAGATAYKRANNAYGVRPSVSLSNQVEITSGNGSVENPYQVILSN